MARQWDLAAGPDALPDAARTALGKRTIPTAVRIDSQPIKMTVYTV